MSKLTQNLTEAAVVDKTGDRVPIYSAASPDELRYMTPDNLVPDASATVEGKVELATDAETITGTDTVRAVTPANVAAKLVDQRSVAETLTNKTLTSPIIKTWDGWQSVSDSWTYASADAPTFTITVPTGAASIYGVGMRIKLTQTTVKYFIITAVADTVLTVYGGTDYTLTSAAISAISYSLMKAPLGFPMNPTKWTVILNDTAQRLQSSPTNNTYYNLGSLSIVIPIGAWDVLFNCSARSDRSSAGTQQIYAALSTSTSAASDNELQGYMINYTTVNISAMMTRLKHLVLAAKTTYYLIMKADGAPSNLIFEGGVSVTTVRAVCAYL